MTSPTTAATAPLPVLQAQPLGPLWPTMDPFLFCAHHDDAYPAGDGAFAPAVPLEGRQIGSDFSRKDGWSMYHGDTVPGFPGHPHRGFETVTLVPVLDRLIVLQPDAWPEYRDRGLAHAALGHKQQAVPDLEAYLRHTDAGQDLDAITDRVAELKREAG